ncbi:MAG: AraC family transcriptional regulator [Akkermansiaceae bacterium]|jgi:AraC-like DNA-binding protein
MTKREIATWTESLRPGTVRDLFEYLPDLMYFAKDSQLRLVAGNRAFVHHCGLSEEEELLGKKDHEIFPPQMADKFAQDDRDILETGKPINDIVELFPNELGIPSWYTTDKIPLFTRTGNVAGLCGLVRNYRVELDQSLQKVTEILSEKYWDRISISDIAKKANLSVRQLERRFQKIYQTTPSQYLMRLRILRACEMLRSGIKPVTTIALDVGFYDHSAFSRNFSKLIGESPSSYRKRFAKKDND